MSLQYLGVGISTLMIMILAGLLVVGALVWRAGKSNPPKGGPAKSKDGVVAKTSAKKKNVRSSSPKEYRATSIQCGDDACDAVKAISGNRFLVRDGNTPLLPLPGCTALKCECIYVHRDDRRDSQEERRHIGAVLQTELYERAGNTDRRQRKRGRRKEDWD